MPDREYLRKNTRAYVAIIVMSLVAMVVLKQDLNDMFAPFGIAGQVVGRIAVVMIFMVVGSKGIVAGSARAAKRQQQEHQ